MKPEHDSHVERPEEKDMLIDTNWRLDKHVPLALLLAIGVQTGGAFWWAAGVTVRVDQLERQIQAVGPQTERLIKLETKFDSMLEAIGELKSILRQQAPPRRSSVD